MYEFALEENQRYKEAHVILEKALIREKEGFVEDLLAWIGLKICVHYLKTANLTTMYRI